MAVQIGLLFLVYAAGSAQAVLAPRLAIGGAVPEFLLVTALAAALTIRGWPGLVWVGVAGLAGDCLSARPIGVGMLAAVVVVVFVQRSLNLRSIAAVIRTACVCTGALSVMILAREAMSAALTGDGIAPAALVSTTAVASAYSALVGLSIFGFCQILRTLVHRLFGPAA